MSICTSERHASWYIPGQIIQQQADPNNVKFKNYSLGPYGEMLSCTGRSSGGEFVKKQLLTQVF